MRLPAWRAERGEDGGFSVPLSASALLGQPGASFFARPKRAWRLILLGIPQIAPHGISESGGD